MRVEKTQKVKVLKRPTWLNLSKPLELNDLCKTSGNEGGERSERNNARRYVGLFCLVKSRGEK